MINQMDMSQNNQWDTLLEIEGKEPRVKFKVSPRRLIHVLHVVNLNCAEIKNKSFFFIFCFSVSLYFFVTCEDLQF